MSIADRNGRRLRLVAYQRTSTDDKGQQPERQGDVIAPWAAREGHDVVATVTDEGTSGAVPPLQRQRVLEALELAEKHEADGIVVEAIDRWTRGGVEDLAVSRFFLRLEHDLRLVVANTPPGLTPEMEELWDAMMAAAARAFRERLRQQIKTGLERAKRLGWPNGEPGRKPKSVMTHEEALACRELLQAGGGWRKMALAVSKLRKFDEAADPKVRRQRLVSAHWVRCQLVPTTRRGRTVPPLTDWCEKIPDLAHGIARRGDRTRRLWATGAGCGRRRKTPPVVSASTNLGGEKV